MAAEEGGVDDPAEVWVLEDACRHGTPPFPSPTLASSRALLACGPFVVSHPAPAVCGVCAVSGAGRATA